ncbi:MULTISPECIES: succinate dehydrogenase/fumarate reductase iron-sulfur subunit [unclassified Dietzia]|uniref:succinate dehydrogenase/fumarate reductase iron-sulfur subunit n=1 Tax=unclassified Dietzia TaxID=2617939 RepID=UPI000D20E33C|nr:MULTISPECIES: succinate dehydrogenase/fumarate reductase iron-sulfur subunit [unclassified Dietzia]AVZ39624.1 succinate dehydrogenase [Dietzia sp. JS16-p6b]MBB1024396.1 succinate dehydrogenase/fumarate reductase iron-sulfur subunit [Dietzia sp. DQ12-76]MBB1027916.1 succinate dehydrogenase/fumarate reductase iron-sulfur subunit [Dietzia sp. DQ11-38-2]QGW24932.1 fumarate reductase, iron-sulfur protein [Dietzia sp. DQ12-45-1b]
MRLTLRVWRQSGPEETGAYEEYAVPDAEPEMSLLELLDVLNGRLIDDGQEPVAFDSDCREGICGACGVSVDGRPHGPAENTPSCHQRLDAYSDGDTLRIEPMRSAVFPVIRDLVVDRSALDRIAEAGAHVSLPAGAAPDADVTSQGHREAETALDLAACIGCGACVAACPNGSANLFVGAKLGHLALMPVASRERGSRAREMVRAADQEFGSCSLYGECSTVCPAGIPLRAIAVVNRERLRALFRRS